MDTEIIIAIIGGGLALLAIITFITKRPHKDLDRSYFQSKWKELLKNAGKKETWPMAIIQADSLLDEALKKRKFKGKTMGERMVSAQRIISNNDSMWAAHKLRNKLVHEVDVPMKEKDVKNALVGLRSALKDLGALR